MKVTVYYKPTCTTSRKVIKALEEKGVEVEKVNYFEKPFSKNKLKTFLKKMGMKAQDLLRKRAKEYKEFDFKNKKYTQAEIIELMVKYPDLIERPIVVKEETVILARPIEKIEEIVK
jgi:arsenate reductase